MICEPRLSPVDGGCSSGGVMMFSMPTTTRSFKESRRELFAVDVLGLSLSNCANRRDMVNVKFLSDTKSDFNEFVDNFRCNLNDWIFT